MSRQRSSRLRGGRITIDIYQKQTKTSDKAEHCNAIIFHYSIWPKPFPQLFSIQRKDFSVDGDFDRQGFGLINNQETMIQKAGRFVREASAVVVGTGAGMGIDSGLPDFRGNQGFWNNYPPYRGKFNFMECANPNFLRTNPHLFWGFYGSRLQMYRQKNPHEGYSMLQQIARQIKKEDDDNIFAVTSNVDGHFLRSNYNSKRVLQVHGSINHLQCGCKHLSNNQFTPEVDYDKMSSKNIPTCDKCGQIMRPNILMFDDWEWMSQRSDQQQKNYYDFLRKWKNERIVIFQIGAGTTVPTIRNMMEQLIYDNKNTTMVRINPDKGISSSRWIDESRYVDVYQSALEGIRKIKEAMC